MTSEFAIVSIDDELAAFLADHDAYAGVDGLIPVQTAPLDADAPAGDPLVLGDDVAAPFGGGDPLGDGSDAFTPVDPGSIDPDAAQVVDPMLSDDGMTFDPAPGDPAAADPAPGGDNAPPSVDPGLSAGTDPAADPGVDAGSDLVLTFEDVDLGSELGVLMVGRSLHAFDFSNLP